MTNTRRWGDNDKHFGPLTFAKDRYAKYGIVLDSGDNEDYPGCNLRFYFRHRTVILELPAIIKPTSRWIDTSHYPWASKHGGYNEVGNKEFGFQLSDGFFQIFYGSQLDNDGPNDRQHKSWFLPWTQWTFYRRSLCDLNGNVIFTQFNGDMKFKPWNEAKKDQPTVVIPFLDFDGEQNEVSCSMEIWEWKFGSSWCQWLAWFRKSEIRKTLELSFVKETGKRKNSYKGGTTAHGITMMPNEDVNSAFDRYCAEHNFTRLSQL